MKELKHNDNWNGGSFNFSTEEVLNKEIVIRSPANAGVGTGKIVKEIKRFGTDHDHGHEYRWESVDYLYQMPDDMFDRNTKLLDLLNRGYLVFLKD